MLKGSAKYRCKMEYESRSEYLYSHLLSWKTFRTLRTAPFPAVLCRNADMPELWVMVTPGGQLIGWYSRRQDIVSLSITEAEYIADCGGAKDASIDYPSLQSPGTIIIVGTYTNWHQYPFPSVPSPFLTPHFYLLHVSPIYHTHGICMGWHPWTINRAPCI